MTIAKAQLEAHADSVLRELLPDQCGDVCVVDVPDHSDVGDQAVLLGEHAWLARHSPDAHMSFLAAADDPERSEPILAAADIILLHGGGDFGTAWADNHRLRLRILDRFSDKTIIQLPLTVSLTDSASVLENRRAIDRTRDFTLMVRDRESLDVATSVLGCRTVLAPDMAYFLDLETCGAPRHDVLCLLKTDQEKAPLRDRIESLVRGTGRSVQSADWPADPISLQNFIGREAQPDPHRLSQPVAGLTTPQVARRLAYARNRLADGVRLLSSGRTVISDRLHAHILCSIMEIEHVALDSADRKVSRFFRTWSEDVRSAHLAENLDDLSATLSALPGPAA